MNSAICFKCGSLKSAAFESCGACNVGPSSDYQRALSLVLCEQISDAAQLQAFALDIQRYGFPIIDPKLMEKGHIALRNPDLKRPAKGTQLATPQINRSTTQTSVA